MARIRFVTCNRWPAISSSDQLVAAELENLGHQVSAAAWNGDFAAFKAAELLVLRSNWDYHYDIEGFSNWLASIAESNIRLCNSVGLVKWNLRKTYLTQLADLGVYCPKTLAIKNVKGLAEAFNQISARSLVIKPDAGASGHLVNLVTKDQVNSKEIAALFSQQERSWIVQEYLSDITDKGEYSLVFIDGEYSHCICKKPQQGDFRVNSQFKGRLSRIQPEENIIQQAKDVLKVLDETPLYARVDGIVMADQKFCLLELELNEPGLYYQLAPEKAAVFAAAIEAKLPG